MRFRLSLLSLSCLNVCLIRPLFGRCFSPVVSLYLHVVCGCLLAAQYQKQIHVLGGLDLLGLKYPLVK